MAPKKGGNIWASVTVTGGERPSTLTWNAVAAGVDVPSRAALKVRISSDGRAVLGLPGGLRRLAAHRLPDRGLGHRRQPLDRAEKDLFRHRRKLPTRRVDVGDLGCSGWPIVSRRQRAAVDAERLEPLHLVVLGGKPSEGRPLDEVIEREQAAHEHGRRRVLPSAVFHVLDAKRPVDRF